MLGASLQVASAFMATSLVVTLKVVVDTKLTKSSCWAEKKGSVAIVCFEEFAEYHVSLLMLPRTTVVVFMCVSGVFCMYESRTSLKINTCFSGGSISIREDDKVCVSSPLMRAVKRLEA